MSNEMEDIRFAVQIHAKDHDIYDKHLVDKLFDEFKTNNYETIEDILDHTFDTDIMNINATHDHILAHVEYSVDSLAHVTNVKNLCAYRNVDTYEQINNREQTLLRTQLHMNHQNAQQSVLNGFNGLLQQFAQGQNNLNVPAPSQNLFGGFIWGFYECFSAAK
jgi:hypothetical protein